MERVVMKGCEAIAEAAIRAGCRFFAGYPITPQNEVPEYFSRKMPQIGGVYLQGESETASAAMLYGAGATGVRAMTSSSSCGISLMSEAIAWMAGACLPVVICNVMRGGPGIGSIQPSQQDYFQATKASGNGGFRMLVLAPSTLQEAVDMVYEAFDLAQKYKNPVLVLADGFTGAMMEPVVLPPARSDAFLAAERKANEAWAATGRKGAEKRHRIGCGERPGAPHIPLEEKNMLDFQMYESWKTTEVDYETYLTEDAELIITAYGVTGRISRSAVDLLRRDGYKVGLIRPKKIHPFPEIAFEQLDYSRLRGILSCEMSIPPQYYYDVDAVVRRRTPIATCLRSGGQIISRNAIIEEAKKLYGAK
ncbi:MAG: 3-methyl-2-oxobutanoate dehydrogenase subunit VorB [Ruminococcaceae bacterium]|nr:3-methyl-2-oxobutanoate dehydrogenase subunit VorB [Oscillospiraceae bacterium]